MERATNKQLAEYLVGSGVLKTPRIISAFKNIDRADFVAKQYLNEAYGNYPLPIGYNATISQPTTVAFMLELLQPQAGEKILDVGSGSGWTAALLAQIVGEQGKVFGVELMPELAEFGGNNLKKYNFKYATVRQASAKLGLFEKAPFDKILVSAAAQKLPSELVNQLKIGGRLVTPIQHSIWQIDKISERKIYKKEFYGFIFVPLK